jgi:hypothetical protein
MKRIMPARRAARKSTFRERSDGSAHARNRAFIGLSCIASGRARTRPDVRAAELQHS